tara:strand:+ start:1317 stop:1436 length:120 start_codon:yes stop_codon:yes gene_type:complete
MPKLGEVYNVDFDGDIFEGVIYDKKEKLIIYILIETSLI